MPELTPEQYAAAADRINAARPEPDPKPWPAGSIPTAEQLLAWLQLPFTDKGLKRSPRHDQRIGTLERILGSAELGVRCMTDQHEHRLTGLREAHDGMAARLDAVVRLVTGETQLETLEERLREIPDDQVTVAARRVCDEHVHRWLSVDPAQACLVPGCDHRGG